MQWIHDYQLFLFDLDGLLVNTEELHHLAYQEVFCSYGVEYDWSFSDFCKFAHYSSQAFKNAVFQQFPSLKSNWETIYEKKQKRVEELIAGGNVQLMPGVKKILNALDENRILTCVVTNSPKRQVLAICSQIPLLSTISHWVTREDYRLPKPDPECYQKAIRSFAGKGEVIGFEDTPRGVLALVQTRATAIFIAQMHYPEISEFERKGVRVFPSFESLVNIAHLPRIDRGQQQ